MKSSYLDPDVEECSSARGINAFPALGTYVSVDPHIGSLERPPRKAGENDRQMAGTRNHRIRLVQVALVGAVRMDVNICYHRQSTLLTNRPELRETPPIEHHDS
jgi:hypothetical protein